MTAFLAIVVLMTAAALALVLGRAPFRATASRRAANATIHAGELEALDREAAAGTMTAEAHRAARDELMRRVLAEGDQDTQPAEGRVPALAISLAVPVVAGALYLLVGNPASLRDDVAVAALDPAAAATVQALEDHLRHEPRDARAWVMLARVHMNADRYAAAAQAYERALAIGGRVERDPLIWCELADALGMAQGGTLRGKPEALIEKALALDPEHPRALEMAGSAAFERGRYRETLLHWDALLSKLAPGTAQHRELEAAVGQVRAQVQFAAHAE